MQYQPMHRRTVLKGIGATLALPFLEAMLPLTAVAAGTAKTAPVRSVFIGVEGGIWTGADGFFPYRSGEDAARAKTWGKNGVLPGGFVADVGSEYKLPATLEPLAAFKKDLLLLSGLHHKNDEIGNTVVNAHGQDLGTLLTGTNISGIPGVALRNGLSVDQMIADKIGEATRLPSLELVVGKNSFNTREATGFGYMGFLSYDAFGNPLPVEGDPTELFDRLFTDGTPQQRARRQADRRRQKSVLDTLRADLKRLESSVAPADRRKLDEYAATIREIERRTERAKQWESQPVRLPTGVRRPVAAKGGPYHDDGGGRIEQMRLMLDLLALALQTDVTRVATLRLGSYVGNFKFLGFSEDPHAVYAHNDGDPKKVAGARAIDKMHVEQLAYFLTKLRGIPEAGGSVLDNSMIFYGAGLTNGPAERIHGNRVTYDAHGQVNAPLLLAGKAGGKLKTGRHLNFDNGTPLCNLYVTMMSLLGIPDAQFNDATGPLTGLV